MKKAFHLTFPPTLITQPVIYQMSKKVDVVFNIRRAKINDRVGELVLELDGSASAMDEAEKWLRAQGVKVGAVTGDSVES